ncbi:MAG: hypothetical protein R2749_06380 [Acidimicrobiales bacterium]
MLRAVLARRLHGALPTESLAQTRMVQLLRDGGLLRIQRQVESSGDSDARSSVGWTCRWTLVVELHAQHNDGARRRPAPSSPFGGRRLPGA